MGVKLGTETSNLSKAVNNAGMDIVDGFKNFKNALTSKKIGTRAEIVESKSGFLMSRVEKSGRFAMSVVETPIAYGVKAVRKGVSGIGSFAKNNPLIAVPLIVVGGVMGVSHIVSKRAEARTQREQDMQMAMIEAQMQQNAMQQPMAQSNSYQITPEEMAQLEARMKGGQGPQTGHAESVIAARQQPEAGTPVTAI